MKMLFRRKAVAGGIHMREKKKNILYILSILSAFFAVVLSEAMPNLTLKILFVICLSAGAICLLSYLNDREPRKKWAAVALAAVTVILLAIPLLRGGSLSDYFVIIGNYVMGKEEAASLSDASVEKICDKLEETTDAVTGRIGDMEQGISDLRSEIMEYQALEQQIAEMAAEASLLSTEQKELTFLSQWTNQNEVNDIVEKIKEEQEKEDGTLTFPDLLSDRHDVELFYKMLISNHTFYYCNIIQAFRIYGIDCDEMHIDEYTLMAWDSETLFALLSMRDKMELPTGEEETKEDWHLQFNDYKIEMEEYSDICEYGGWRMSYENQTASEVMESLNRRINSYYKKLHINFKDA